MLLMGLTKELKTSYFSILLLLSVLLDYAYCGEKSLYTDQDHILELDVNNFNANVYNQVGGFFLLFVFSVLLVFGMH